jgi:molecular chaperone GrpE
MKKHKEPDLQEDLQDPFEPESAASVDDFLRELEAKEKDLHITADLSIEIEESEFEYSNVPDFIAQELKTQAQDPGTKTTQPNASEQRLKSEVTALKNQISDLKADRLKLVDRNKQQMREFDNLKSRMDRERRETFVSQVSNLATAMLPVLDNLDRALDFASQLKEEQSEEFKQFSEGIVLVNQQIVEVLAGMGVVPITTVGEVFDPHFHEAVAVEPTEGLEENTISKELMRGYRIGEKIIRHSMVKVVGGGSGKLIPPLAEPVVEEAPHEDPEPLPAMDDEVEELIASSYANGAEDEQEEK